MNKKSKRKQDIVFLNVLFCLLVIFIHCSSEIVVQMDHGRMMSQIVRVLSRLSGFVVQGFLFLSGMKMFLKPERIRYGRFYVSRLTTVVLPYVLWVAIYYFYFCYRGIFPFSWGELGRYILWGDLSAQFYFVVVIVQFYLLMPLWQWVYRRVHPVILLIAAYGITTLCLSGLPELAAAVFPDRPLEHLDVLCVRYLFYWTAGCVVGMHEQAFQEALRKHWLGILIFFLAMAFADAWLSVFCTVTLPIRMMDSIHTLYSVSAILFFCVLARWFTNGGRASLGPIGILDRVTYHVYLIHCLVIFAANEWMSRVGIENLVTRYMIRVAAAYFGSIALCLAWYGIKRLISRAAENT